MGVMVGASVWIGSGVCVGTGDDVGGTEVAVGTGSGVSGADGPVPQAKRESIVSATIAITVKTGRVDTIDGR